MKTLKIILVVSAMILSFSTYAQVKTETSSVDMSEVSITNPRSYWQFSLRGGYDFPNYSFAEDVPDMKFIEHDGGFMAGASVNYYWDWFGVQGDFDYIRNTPNAKNIPNYYLFQEAGITELYDLTHTVEKDDITRLFYGIGPAFKYQSATNNFTLELGLLAGLGSVQGGEILVDGIYNDNNNNLNFALAYHSGFDSKNLFIGKAQLRGAYFFNDNWGAHIGGYYMQYFDEIEESLDNTILKNNYGEDTTDPIYFFERKTTPFEVEDGETLITGIAFNDDGDIRGKFQDLDSKLNWNLSSFGIFVGITYKIPTKLKQDGDPEECLNCDKFGVTITAKDKFTGEILPNTDVVLKNAEGEVVASGETDGSGVVNFNDIPLNDYTIEAKLYEVALENSTITRSEFIPNEILQKQVMYTDRNFIVKGKVFECNSTNPLNDVNVIIENNAKAFKKTTNTDNIGNFILHLQESGTYSLYGKKGNYFSQTEEVNANNYNRDRTLFVQIEICSEKADCDKAIQLKDINFGLDDDSITEKAKKELNKLVRFMQDNPNVKIELSSHTDSQGSDPYNEALSQRRANNSKKYLISQGIDASRIVAKGYGEYKLKNTKCKNGVPCTDAEHEINRRTEFQVNCP